MTRLADKPRPLRSAKQKLEPAAAGKQKRARSSGGRKKASKKQIQVFYSGDTEKPMWGDYIFLATLSHYRPCAGAHVFWRT